MSRAVWEGSHVHLTELDEVDVYRSSPTPGCNAVLTAVPDGSGATFAALPYAWNCGSFTPDRWGAYEVRTGSGTGSDPYVTTTIEFWPVAYETVVAWDLAIPIAGLYWTPSGDAIAIYAEPMTPRADRWWKTVKAPGQEVRAWAADGISFVQHQKAPDRAALIGSASSTGVDLTVNFAGYGRIRDVGAEWLMHTVEGGTEFWRWSDTRGPFLGPGPKGMGLVTHHHMTLYQPFTGAVDWTADAYDNYELKNTQDSILEPLEHFAADRARLVMAYQDGNNWPAILHLPVVRGHAAGSFARPAGCGAPCQPIQGDGGAANTVDTPWFFPEFGEPFGEESLRLTALYHPKQQAGEKRENTGWASWSRAVGAASEVWDYEGMFFTLDDSQEGLRNDPDIHFTDLDFTCTQGDHTIVTLDGVDYMYVPVSTFRGWWPSTDPVRQAAFEEHFVDFIAEDVAAGYDLYYTVDATAEKFSFTTAGLIDMFSITAASTPSDGGFHCGYCTVYRNLIRKDQLRLPVRISFVGTKEGERLYEVELDESLVDETEWEDVPCVLALGNAFYDEAYEEWADPAVFGGENLDDVDDERKRVAAGYAALCARYCMDIPLVLATSRSVGS